MDEGVDDNPIVWVLNIVRKSHPRYGMPADVCTGNPPNTLRSTGGDKILEASKF